MNLMVNLAKWKVLNDLLPCISANESNSSMDISTYAAQLFTKHVKLAGNSK